MQLQCSNVIFADESSFHVRPKKSKVRVRRKSEQRYIRSYTAATFRSVNKSSMIQDGLSVHESTPLVEIFWSSGQNKYHVIIDTHVLLFVY